MLQENFFIDLQNFIHEKLIFFYPVYGILHETKWVYALIIWVFFMSIKFPIKYLDYIRLERTSCNMSCLFGKLFIFRLRLCLVFLPCHSYKTSNKIVVRSCQKKWKFVLLIPSLHPSCAFCFFKSKRAQKEEAKVSSMKVF